MSINILIIEDDLVLAHGLKENLMEMGYDKIEMASSSEEALIKSSRMHPDIFLVDIILENSELNGIELVEQLQQTNDGPFIYLTSMDDEATRSRAKSSNPSAYLIKPASKAQLGVTIDLAMNNYYRFKQKMEAFDIGIETPQKKIFVKSGERYQRININEIAYMEAQSSYCVIHTNVKSYTISQPLKKVLKELNSDQIFRTHKTYAVSENHISSFDQNTLYIECRRVSVPIPISRTHRETVLGRLKRI
jgi:DNA-binding LytR/AlgR family response regulator